MHTRLGLNHGGYHGERIGIWDVLKEMDGHARRHGWEALPLDFEVPGRGFIPAYHRRGTAAGPRVYLSSGMHGDEPAGPLAMLRLLRENPWPSSMNLWIVPCLNPRGFERNTRENEEGFDLNRDYRSLRTALVKSHIRWLNALPSLGLGLLLHEDWESHGFYLYELNPHRQPSLSGVMLDAVAKVCPIDLNSEIEGREASGGLISFVGEIPDREDWPEALYLIHHKCGLNYTLEGPSDFALPTRVDALTHAVQAALAEVQARHIVSSLG